MSGGFPTAEFGNFRTISDHLDCLFGPQTADLAFPLNRPQSLYTGCLQGKSPEIKMATLTGFEPVSPP